MIWTIWNKIAAWLGFPQPEPEPEQPPLPPLIEDPCLICGAELPKFKQKYCSELCRKIARRERERQHE